MSLTAADTFSTYPVDAPLPAGRWAVRDAPTVEAGGRNGGHYLAWDTNAIAFGGGTFWRAAYQITTGGNIHTWRNTVAGFPTGTLPTWSWLCGGAWRGYAYAGLVVTEDGAIHVARGGGFEGGPNATNAEVVASSAAGVVPVGRGWFLLEAAFGWGVAGSVAVRINGVPVLSYSGPTVSTEDYCTQILNATACPLESDSLWPAYVDAFGVGGFTRGAQAVRFGGWVGKLGLAALFSTDPGDVADMAVTDLIPTGAGAVSQSTIGGTTPAPTRWQSVDDALAPDDGATFVTFSSATTPAADEYTLPAFPYGAATIYGVQGAGRHQVSHPGYSVARFGASDGSTVAWSAPLFSRTRTWQWHSAAIPTAPDGGTWTVADLAGVRLRVERAV